MTDTPIEVWERAERIVMICDRLMVRDGVSAEALAPIYEYAESLVQPDEACGD